MRKIVIVQQKKKRNHFKMYPLKRRHHAGPKKKFSGRKNRNFSEEISLKERLQKSVLYAKDQAILQKIVQKMRKQQSFLNKHRFMQMTLLSQMWNHFSHLMMTTLLNLQQSWLIPHQKRIQTQIVMMSQTQKSKLFIHPILLLLL